MAISPSEPVQRVLDRLESVKPSGGGWSARCPAHIDRAPSLSITEGDDGRALLHCHAGCPPQSIVTAVGLSMTDLFQARSGTENSSVAPRGRMTAFYQYTDEDGAVLFESVRFEPKTFRQRRPGPDESRPLWGMKGVRLVPYRLPELVTAVKAGQTVFIAEGEKDVETLRRWGLAATCNPMGAGKWKMVEAIARKVLAGARVVVIPDDDEPGRRHAQEVAESLRCVAATVKALPPFPGAKDVTEWKESGGTCEQLLEIVENAATYGTVTITGGVVRESPTKAPGLNVRRVSDLMQKTFDPLRMIIPDLLPEGYSVLVGRPKLGKSFMALDWCVAIAIGGHALGTYRCDPGGVLYCGLEDSERRLQQRLSEILKGRPVPENFHYLAAGDLPKLNDGGLELLDKYLRENPGIRFLSLDTYARVRPPKPKNVEPFQFDYDNGKVLADLGRVHRLALQAVIHARKEPGEDFIDEINASMGVAAAADVIYVMRRARKSQDFELNVTGKDVPEQCLGVHFDFGMKEWCVVGGAEVIRLSREHRDVLDVMQRAGRPMTATEVAETLSESRDTIAHRFETLLKKDLLDQVGYGKYLPHSVHSSLSVHGVHSAHDQTEKSEESEVVSTSPQEKQG